MATDDLPPAVTADDPSQRRVVSVSELTRNIKDVLEGHFQSVWVAGEIRTFPARSRDTVI
jgi:exonuclease VII large subunit